MRRARVCLILAALLMPPLLAGAADTTPNPGITDICWNEQVYIFNGENKSQYTNEDYLRFRSCEDQKITKADCTVSDKKALVGVVKYQIASGFSKGINRCEKSKCAVLSDSTLTALVQKGCNAGVPLGGAPVECTKDTPRSAIAGSTALAQGCAFASDVASKVGNLPDGSLDGTKAVIGMCSNNSSECIQNCPGSQCPISKAIEGAYAKGAENVLVSGVGSGVTNSDQVNKLLEDISKETGATYMGSPTLLADDGVHFADAQYNEILRQVGEFEAVPGNLASIQRPPVFDGHETIIGSPSTNYSGGGDMAETTPARSGTLFAKGRYIDMHDQIEKDSGLNERGYGGLLNKVAIIEGTGGDPKICSFSGPCGHFQYSKATWDADSARINGGVSLPYGDRFNPEISAKVAAASYVYYIDRYGDAITASGMDKYAAVYTFHNAGESGGLKLINAYGADSSTKVYDLMGATQIENNRIIYRNGNITLSQAQDNILAGMSRTSAPRSSTLATIMNPLNGTVGDNSGGGWTVLPDRGFASGPVTRYIDRQGNIIDIREPIYSAGYGSGGSSMFGGMGIGNSLGSFFSNLFGGTSNQPARPTPPPPPPPTVSISVLPNPVRRGTSVTVAWSSNGTSLTSLCQVKNQEGAIIATGGGGSQSVATGSSTPATLTFTVSCIGVQAGQLVQQKASTAVQ